MKRSSKMDDEFLTSRASIRSFFRSFLRSLLVLSLSLSPSMTRTQLAVSLQVVKLLSSCLFLLLLAVRVTWVYLFAFSLHTLLPSSLSSSFFFFFFFIIFLSPPHTMSHLSSNSFDAQIHSLARPELWRCPTSTSHGMRHTARKMYTDALGRDYFYWCFSLSFSPFTAATDAPGDADVCVCVCVCWWNSHIWKIPLPLTAISNVTHSLWITCQTLSLSLSLSFSLLCSLPCAELGFACHSVLVDHCYHGHWATCVHLACNFGDNRLPLSCGGAKCRQIEGSTPPQTAS